MGIQIHCLYDALVDPKSLIEHEHNRNNHDDDQVERLARLYIHNGIRHPIICDVDNKSSIIVGRCRQLAAIRAGLKEFPVVYQGFESEAQKYSFIQSDNAIGAWSRLDFAAINLDLANIGPFNIEALGIKDFFVDPAEKEKKQKKDKAQTVCPACGEVF